MGFQMYLLSLFTSISQVCIIFVTLQHLQNQFIVILGALNFKEISLNGVWL